MELMRTILYLITGIILVFTLVPLIRHEYWVFRIFDYPRFQKFILAIVFFALYFLLDHFENIDYIFTLLLGINVVYLGYLIFPYTSFVPPQLKSVSQGPEANEVIKILVANVYQPNKNVKALLKNIQKCDPDLLLLIETDDWWRNALEELQEKYPEMILHPLNNTYGMLLYSRFPLRNQEVKFLVEKDKPSIHTLVTLPSGRNIKLFGIHPAPPAPQHNEYSTERDKELLIIGKMAEKEDLPVIVTGDLNDVAWSYTTRLFMKISHLLDPRIGRGMYNTYHAKYPVFRWPLDHIFCSEHFKLIRLKKLRYCGSDHFPLFTELALSEDGHSGSEIPVASEEDKELVEEKVNKENLSE